MRELLLGVGYNKLNNSFSAEDPAKRRLAFNLLVGKFKESDLFEDLGVEGDVKMDHKWILKM
jgi:hypothetical protein